MVYKFAARTSGGAGWFLKLMLPFHLGATLGILALFLSIDTANWLPALVGVVAGNLVALAACWPSVRSMNRRFALLGDQFLTLTESGVMVESNHAGVRSYIPWSQVCRAVVKRDMLLLQQADSRCHLLPIGKMPREKVNAVLDYVRTHAGKTGDAPVPPPADLLTTSAVLGCSSPATHRAWVDRLALQMNRVLLPLGYFMISLLSAEMFISFLSTGEVGIVALALLLLFLAFVLRPGLSIPHLLRHVESRQVHITPGGVLTISASGLWQIIPTRHFTRAKQTRRSIYYIAPGFPSIVPVDSAEPSPLLPQPRRCTVWPRVLALLTCLIGVPALAAGLLVMLEEPVDEFDADPSSMTPALRKAYDRGSALAAEAESYIPPQPYPGPIIGCVVFDEADSVIMLGCEWESGLEIWLSLPQSAGQDGDSTAK